MLKRSLRLSLGLEGNVAKIILEFLPQEQEKKEVALEYSIISVPVEEVKHIEKKTIGDDASPNSATLNNCYRNFFKD